VARKALGVRMHEAAPTDPATGIVYLTEDDHDGRLYRFLPDRWGDLSSGALFAASVGAGGLVTWIQVSPKWPARGKDTTLFDRGEGAWISHGKLYFSTTAADCVWELDLATQRIAVIYDGQGANAADALHEPDNVTVHERTGHAFVAEDADDVQLVRAGSSWAAVPFLQFAGHDGSEVTGPVFSPDGSRLYVNSQRGLDGDGMTFEISGPFAAA